MIWPEEETTGGKRFDTNFTNGLPGQGKDAIALWDSGRMTCLWTAVAERSGDTALGWRGAPGKNPPCKLTSCFISPGSADSQSAVAAALCRRTPKYALAYHWDSGTTTGAQTDGALTSRKCKVSFGALGNKGVFDLRRILIELRCAANSGCGRMTIDDQKEQFSFAYARAVAAVAQVVVNEPTVDDDSVDLLFKKKGGGGVVRSPQLDVQVKCTESANIQADHPDDLVDWLNHSEQELAMRKCGYWVSLRGMAATTNQTSVTVHLPRANQFTVAQLTQIMQRIGNNQTP